jgi:hypothetical protein
MKQETEKNAAGKAVLSYFNLSSHYERKARLLPGLLCAMALVPVGATFGTPLGDWLGLIATGVGLWAVCGVGLSHLASAAGNRFQEKLWPRWPYDAPTNQWLHPDNWAVSTQQKTQMNEAIKRLTGLDVEAAVEHGPDEVEAVINDCVARLRHRLRNSPHADRLDVHNADYGFARNFAGLRPLWLTFLAFGAAVTWVAYARYGRPVVWPVVSTVLLAVGALVSFGLERYVRVRSRHYTDSFFSAVLELDAAERKDLPGSDAAKAKRQATKRRANEPDPK